MLGDSLGWLLALLDLLKVTIEIDSCSDTRLDGIHLRGVMEAELYSSLNEPFGVLDSYSKQEPESVRAAKLDAVKPALWKAVMRVFQGFLGTTN